MREQGATRLAIEGSGQLQRTHHRGRDDGRLLGGCPLFLKTDSWGEFVFDFAWARAWESKIPRILSGSGAVVLATWLPDPSATGGAPELTENNQEHIAAASAAVQNLLLAAEARGLRTYWATGGILKDKDVFGWLGIPANQILLGAIFMAPTELPHDMLETGSWREKRGEPSNWSVWIEPGQLAETLRD